MLNKNVLLPRVNTDFNSNRNKFKLIAKIQGDGHAGGSGSGGRGGGVGTNVSCRLNFRLLASFQLNCY